LASAIAAARERRELIAAATNAVARAEESIWTAEEKRDSAEKALEDTKAAEIEHLVAKAAGRDSAAPAPVSAAKRELADAEDALTMAREVHRRLLAEQADATRHEWLPEQRVRDAVAGVVGRSPELAELVEKVAKLQLELVEYGCALLHLAGKSALPPERTPDGLRFSQAYMTVARLKSPMPMWGELVNETGSGLRPTTNGATVNEWESALASLVNDANVALPTVE
jgi:hypothetical protein